MLRVESLHAFYGDSHVLQGVSLEVPEGALVALLGRNGAGKSTTVKAITGTVKPAGSVRIAGQEVAGRPPEVFARMGVGLVPQGRRIFPNLTVRENLTLGARPGPWTEAKVYDLFPRLRERVRNLGSQLSGGEQQMVAIGRALLMNPRLLLLDEPSEGLAPLVVRQLGEVLGRLKKERLSILLVEQNLPLALSLADQVYVLNKGQTVHRSTPDALQGDQAVKRMYLGV